MGAQRLCWFCHVAAQICLFPIRVIELMHIKSNVIHCKVAASVLQHIRRRPTIRKHYALLKVLSKTGVAFNHIN